MSTARTSRGRRGHDDELRALSADLANLLETVDVPIVILDAAGRIRRFSPKAGAFLGLAPGSAGTSIGDVALARVNPDLELWLSQTMRTGAMVEAEVQDPAQRWYRMQIRPHRALDGRADGTIISLVDIHALKDDVADAVWERDYARSIVEAVPTPLVVVDGQLRVLSANEAFHAAFGVGADGAEGRGFFDVVGGGWDIAALRRALGSVLEEDARFRDLKLERDGPGGRRTLSLSARSVPSRTAARTILLGLDDVTDRIEGERLSAELLVRAEQAQAVAERANAAKDRFLGFLSHALRRPLTSLLLQAEVLRAGVPDPAKLRRVATAVERGAAAQLRLVDELLDATSIVSGTLRLDEHRVDLEEVVLAALAEVQGPALAKSLRVEAAIAPGIPRFRGDPLRLRQVLASLLDNAVAFTPDGGRLGVTLAREGGSARVTVSDSGCGIDPAFLPHVFDRFAQGDGPGEGGRRGLGLGLTIAHHLVALHGGTVRGESPGKNLGATFTVTLPLRDLDEAPPLPVARERGGAAPPAPEGQRLAAVRILVVDDDDVREAIAELLTSEGAAVETRASAQAGIDAVEHFHPQLILCDLTMPGEDGYAFVRRLRALDGARGGAVPVVAFTAVAGGAERRRCLAAGFQAHLSKPASRAEVLEALESVLGLERQGGAPPRAASGAHATR
jgi:two-component system, chemotaxis family, CheB/CheR fusion protein